MLEEFMGIPAHPLLVHAAVVFVPLLALLAIGYSLVPLIRPHTRWVLGTLAIVAPISALLSKLSGDAFFARLDEREAISEGFYPVIEEHQRLGNFTLGTAITLGVVTVALVYFLPTRQQRLDWVSILLSVLAVVAAAVSLYFVIRSGDTGAKAVWTGR